VLTILAYAWVIKGMILVYSPHFARDAIQFVTQSPQRLRFLSAIGVAYGVLILALAIFVYPS
jgi:uncharacterized protein YjeT (DUF2065 family)